MKTWLYIYSQMGLLISHVPTFWSWNILPKESLSLMKRPIYPGFCLCGSEAKREKMSNSCIHVEDHGYQTSHSPWWYRISPLVDKKFIHRKTEFPPLSIFWEIYFGLFCMIWVILVSYWSHCQTESPNKGALIKSCPELFALLNSTGTEMLFLSLRFSSLPLYSCFHFFPLYFPHSLLPSLSLSLIPIHPSIHFSFCENDK